MSKIQISSLHVIGFCIRKKKLLTFIVSVFTASAYSLTVLASSSKCCVFLNICNVVLNVSINVVLCVNVQKKNENYSLMKLTQSTLK